MQVVEFTNGLHGAPSFPIQRNIATQLPNSDIARVIVLTNSDDDAEWQSAGYVRFLKDDS
jgi:hypothetical protein